MSPCSVSGAPELLSPMRFGGLGKCKEYKANRAFQKGKWEPWCSLCVWRVERPQRCRVRHLPPPFPAVPTQLPGNATIQRQVAAAFSYQSRVQLAPAASWVRPCQQNSCEPSAHSVQQHNQPQQLGRRGREAALPVLLKGTSLTFLFFH